MTMPTWLLVALGGAVGTSARYALSLVVKDRGWSSAIGTGTVNIVGCFLIGLLYTRTEDPVLRRTLGIGVLGGFTTFSSFGYETLAFLKAGRIDLAFGSVAANLVLGLLGVWLGQRVGGSAA